MAKKRTKKKPRARVALPCLDWLRAKKDETICAHRRTWESRCREFKIVESVGKFSEMGTIYYAIWRGDGFERIISKHRGRKPAEKSCEKMAKERQPIIIEYTNLLHKHGVGSKECEDFKHKHREKAVFLRRAATLEKLIALKNK